MATRNTPEDLSFAVLFLDYSSRRAMSPEARAKAQLLLALVKMLDVRSPGWREAYLEHLEATSVTKEIKDLFELPLAPSERLFDEFLSNLMGNKDVSANDS